MKIRDDLMKIETNSFGTFVVMPVDSSHFIIEETERMKLQDSIRTLLLSKGISGGGWSQLHPEMKVLDSDGNERTLGEVENPAGFRYYFKYAVG